MKKKRFDFNESLLDYKEILYIEKLIKQQKQLKSTILSSRIMGRVIKK